MTLVSHDISKKEKTQRKDHYCLNFPNSADVFMVKYKGLYTLLVRLRSVKGVWAMKHSISKLILRLILLVTVAMIAILTVFNIIEAKNEAYDHAELEAYNAALTLSNACKNRSKDTLFADKDFKENLYDQMGMIIEEYNLLFLYIVDVDETTSVIRYDYLMGSEGTEDVVKETLAQGSIQRDTISDEMLLVMRGTLPSGVAVEMNNQNGHVYSYYLPLYDNQNKVVAVIGADVSYKKVIIHLLKGLPRKLIVVLLVGILSALFLYFFIKKKVVSPIRNISKAMSGFGKDGHYEVPALGGVGEDEFGLINESFGQMAETIKDNVSSIKKYTEIQSRQAYELKTAAGIQKGFLPGEYFENDLSEIHASMKAAKNVGGDFYDYFEDHGHQVVVIADVSGKGLSGAIFMAGAISLMRGIVKQGLEPHEVLMAVNRELENTNPNMMFVTLFLAYIDEERGMIRYANAGHNPPYIISDGRIKTLTGSGGVPLGILGDEIYETVEEVFPLGSTLFLYTDGINEAADKDGTFFGMERLEKVLRENSGEMVITAMEKAVEEFTAGSEQWDDMTMLSFTSRAEKLVLPAEKSSFDQLRNWIIRDEKVPQEMKNTWRLIAEEIFINIASYAYDENGGEVIIRKQMQGNNGLLQFTDSGKSFDPCKDVQDIDEYDPFKQVGGLGRFMVQNLSDEWHYCNMEGNNILLVYKKTEKQEES